MAHLTERLKKEYTPKLLHEFGFVCYQCDRILEKGKYVYEHLNGNRLDSRYENICWSHQSCNVKKENYSDMQIKAIELLRRREEAGIDFISTPDAVEEITSERDVNKTLFPFTEQMLSERINTDGNYPLKDALAEIPYAAQKRFGFGSEGAVRRYVKQLTCKQAPFDTITNNKGEKLIVKRVGN